MLDDFLNRLDKVRRTGENYTAICPVGNHSGRNRTLSIKEDNGRVIGQCFSCGARVKDVADVLGLGMEHIDAYWKPRNSEDRIPYYPKDLKKKDRYIIEEYNKVEDKDTLSYQDKKAYNLANQRLTNYNEKIYKIMYT
jgi:hypothetical protein